MDELISNDIDYLKFAFIMWILIVSLELRHISGVNWHLIYITCCATRHSRVSVKSGGKRKFEDVSLQG